MFEGESVDRYNFRPALRRLLREPEPMRRIRAANPSPVKPKPRKGDAKVTKQDKHQAKLTEQRDDARSQLKSANAELKRSQENLKAAHKQIGSLEGTVAKLKEKAVPPAKNTDTDELKALVNKSVQHILDEIKSVRTSNVSLHEAVANLANAPIEITQPTPIPVAPVSRSSSSVDPPHSRQHFFDPVPMYSHSVNRSQDYGEMQQPQHMLMEYQYGNRQQPFQPTTFGRPEHVNQGQHVSHVSPPPAQFQVRRIVPPGLSVPIVPLVSEARTAETTSVDAPRKKRGKR